MRSPYCAEEDALILSMSKNGYHAMRISRELLTRGYNRSRSAVRARRELLLGLTSRKPISSYKTSDMRWDFRMALEKRYRTINERVE